MKLVYIILLLGLAATFYLVETLPDAGIIARYGPDLVTELLVLIVTLAIVQRALERQERMRRLRASVGVLREGGRFLGMLVDTWATLLKGCIRPSHYSPPVELDELFAPAIAEKLRDLDPQALSSLGVPWIGWALGRSAEAREGLRAAAKLNPASVGVDYLELLDAVISDPFLERMLHEAPQHTEPREWRVWISSMPGYRDAFFERLAKTVHEHNALARKVGRLRPRHSRPRRGFSGGQLAGDHDLRIRTRFEADWWWDTPEPGTLERSDLV